MHTFNAVLAVKPCGVVLEEYLDVLGSHHSLLHYLGSAEEWLADNEVNLTAQLRQIECILARCVAASHNGCNLLAVEETVACGACGHSLSVVFLLVGKSEILCRCSCGYDYGVGLNLVTLVESDYCRTGAEIHVGDDARNDLRSETFCLLLHLHHHLVSIHSVGITGEILNDCCLCQLSTHLRTAHYDGAKVSPACINGSGVSCWSAAYY